MTNKINWPFFEMLFLKISIYFKIFERIRQHQKIIFFNNGLTCTMILFTGNYLPKEALKIRVNIKIMLTLKSCFYSFTLLTTTLVYLKAKLLILRVISKFQDSQ